VLLFGDQITPEIIIAIASILLVALPFHEFAHALAAFRLGDPTAKYLGRLTLNPLRHLDPLGALLIVLVGFGWAKPTPFNPLNLRSGKVGEAIIAAAGPLSNLALAAAAALPLRYILASDIEVPDLVIQTLYIFVVFNVILMIFNLVPIPPLDGSKLVFAAMNRETEMRWRPVLEQYGFLLLIAAMFLPILPGGTIVGVLLREVGYPIVDLLIGRG
jgi:Zn-dependent protease